MDSSELLTEGAGAAVVPPAPTGKAVVVLGVTSSMARARAGEFAAQKYDLVVAARDIEENEIIAADLRVRYGVNVTALPFEAEDFAGHQAFFDTCCRTLGDRLAGVVVCFGFLEEQAIAQRDFDVARRTLDVNFTAAVSVCERFAALFEQRKTATPKGQSPGFIAAISSVAGDRGRQSNYMYGAAKAGLSAYLQGLRNRLSKSNVPVITIKPGFIDTKMTFGMEKVFLVASPGDTAKKICAAIGKGRDIVYVPWFWRYIMLIITHVPERIFKRLSL
jgi:decaprenylphospho-beta-D-erythro-pentofuranosid-2-ulose 2-reductase